MNQLSNLWAPQNPEVGWNHKFNLKKNSKANRQEKNLGRISKIYGENAKIVRAIPWSSKFGTIPLTLRVVPMILT
jgi:hypothetical protein